MEPKEKINEFHKIVNHQQGVCSISLIFDFVKPKESVLSVFKKAGFVFFGFLRLVL